MSNIYVKLKEEYAKQPDAMAKYIYGQLIYPGDNDRWVIFREEFLERIKRHQDIDFLDIKTQYEIDAINAKRKNDIEDVVNGNWKRSEKTINQIEDQEKLKEIKKLAINNDRKIIIKLVDARLEELKMLGEVN